MRIIVLIMMSFVMNLSIAQNIKIRVVKEKLKSVSNTKREYEVIDNGLDHQYGYFLKHGYYKEFFKKDVVVSGHYKHDQKEGDWIYKDPEGNYLQKGSFHEGEKVGEWYSYKKDLVTTKEYYSDKGRLDSVFRYDNNDELVWYYYYDSIHKINYSKYNFGLGLKKEVIRTDSIELNIKLLYPNGQLLEERVFKNERLVYVSDIYNMEGNIMIPTKMNGGNGLLQTIRLDSILDGKYSIKDEVYYENGIPEGYQVRYDLKRKILSGGFNKEGFPFGKWSTWNKKKGEYTYKTHILNSKKKKENIKVYSANRDVVGHGLPYEIRDHHPPMFMKNRNKKNSFNYKKYFSEIVSKCVRENLNSKELSKYFVFKNGVYKMSIAFKINTLGEISDVKLKSKSKSILVKHAIENALGKLPTLIPAGTSERGMFVNLMFNLPLVFRI